MRLTQYDPLAFNKLPTISQAGQDFDAINGDDLISTEFRELFQRHKMDRKFGLCLLHNHFPLEEHERLVEYRGTCVPWKLGKMTRTLQPSAWMISPDDAIQPYEFHFEPTGAEPDLQNPSVQAFLDELTSYLNKHSVRRLFGLCTYPGDDFKGRLEITEGRANINLQPGDVRLNPSCSMMIFQC